jgi:hypothetical protein
MRSLLSLFFVVVLSCGVAKADSTIHSLPTQATVPIPANSCFLVDQGPGTPAALCNQYATAMGALGNTTVTKTTNYIVLGTDNGTTFDNSGAVGEVDFTLPTESGNLNFGFCVVATQIVKVIAPASTKISFGAVNTANAGSLQSSTPFNCLWVYSYNGATAQYVAKAALGDWSGAPTISSGFGGTPSVTANNGPSSFEVNVGTGGAASSGVVGLPTATNGWDCSGVDITTQSSSVFLTKQTASATNSATFTNYNTAGAATAWVGSDKLRISCMPY